MTAYFIFKEDLEGLTNCHAKFQACEELEIGDSTVRESSRALQLNMDFTGLQKVKRTIYA